MSKKAVQLISVCTLGTVLVACSGSSGSDVDNGPEDLENPDSTILTIGPFPPDADDPDGDSLSADEELLLNLDPNNADSDGDGIFDHDEDNDGDGDSNLDEIANGSDPLDAASTIDLVFGNPGPSDEAIALIGCQDTNSSNADWSDNCVQVRLDGDSTSSYTQGVQRILFCQGFSGGSETINDFADGLYSEITEQSVRDFQAANNITVDGIVGPPTWGALFDTLRIIEGNIEIGGVLYVQHSIAGCDAGTVQFFQETDGTDLFGWQMALTPGSIDLTDFSTGPAVPVN